VPHDHHPHAHGHLDADTGDRRVALAVGVNLALTVAQIAGGVVSGSVALIADAVHNLSDAITLVIAFAARRIARRPADAAMTFGYGRAEVVAALINYVTLIVISLWLFYEGVLRLLDPPGVDGWIVIALAGVALVIDLATAALTYSMAKDSLNIRAAFLHNLADAASSVVVIVAGGLILAYDWRLVDPLATIGIAGWILWQALAEVRPAIRILMLGAPPQFGAQAVLDRILAEPGVDSAHHLTLWQIDEVANALGAHVVLTPGADAGAVVAGLRAALADAFHLHHITLSVETEATRCVDPPRIGC
jgi:cobalt-zinc-cadmium efflux system protein